MIGASTRLASIAVGLAGLLTVAGSAGAALPKASQSTQISSLKSYGCGLAADVGDNGTGVIAFTGASSFGPSAKVYVRRLSPTATSFGPVLDVHSGSNACGVSVAVASDGTIAVGWFRLVGNTRYLEAATARPGKGFGKVQLIQTSTINNSVTRLKMLAVPGGFVFSWRLWVGGSSPDQIRYSTSDLSGTFSSWKLLTNNVGWTASAVQRGNDGDVFALFTSRSSTASARAGLLAEVYKSASGQAIAAPQGLATTDARNDEFSTGYLRDMRSGPSGLGFTFEESVGGARSYYWSTFASGAVLGQLSRIPSTYPAYTGPGDGMPLTYGPAIAMPLGGNPVLGWTEGISVVGDSDVVISSRMKVAVGLPDGTTSTPIEVSGLDSFANLPVAASVGATGIVAWAETSKTLARPLRYTLVSQDGTSSAKATLGTSDMRGTLVIASGQQKGIAAWVSGNRVRASVIR